MISQAERREAAARVNRRARGRQRQADRSKRARPAKKALKKCVSTSLATIDGHCALTARGWRVGSAPRPALQAFRRRPLSSNRLP